MDVVSLIAAVRDLYREQFDAFVAQQRRAHPTGVAEVKLRLSDGSGLLHDLFCVDFLVLGEAAPEAIELHPERQLGFEPFEGGFGGLRVRFEELRWDDAVVRWVGGAGPDPEALETWFTLWFDPLELRTSAANDEDAALSGVIHSLAVADGALHVDFGTAPPAAFWELLQLLADSGAAAATVGAGNEEEED